MNIRIVVRKVLSYVLPDKLYLKIIYYLTFKRKLNLKDPKYWTEKVQYKKLYDRREKVMQVADKVLIRDYSKMILNKDIMPELYWVGESPEDIPFETLPEKFVIKTNHGAGTNIIIYNKKNINTSEVIEQLKEWLEIDYYSFEKEWAYKNIKRKVLVEKLYLNTSGEIPKDIKLYMFNGELGAINIHSGRFDENHENLFLDQNFIDLFNTNSNRKDLKPPKFDEMLEYAKKLSLDFDFIRVDFYELDDKVLLGEMTNYPVGGYKHMPLEVDKMLGDMWK